jgi:hypothetical protein
MKARVTIFVLAIVCVGGPARAQESDGVAALLSRVERALQAGDAAAYFDLLTPQANRERAQEFASTEFVSGAARTSLQERDRQPLINAAPNAGYRLLVDVFADLRTHARIATWRLDVVRTGAPGGDREWAIADEERVSSVESIYRLTLDASRSFAAHGLKISAEDLDLELPEGTVFVAGVDQGVTALVLLGRGTVNFHPAPATERGQVKIFCGRETLVTRFDTVFIRINPNDFELTVNTSQLKIKAVDPRELKRAQEVFREESQKSFGIDLADLSRDSWFLLPGPGDFLAEMHTRRFDTLTYAKSSTEAEDITLFDRKRRHNIALYASQDKLAKRGRFYNEDDLVDYDVLDYDIDVASTPDRMWIDGRARLRLEVRAATLGALTLRLADSLVVRSIVSYEYGRLFGIRVKNQNMLVINLPTAAQRDTVITLTIAYGGRLEPQTPERETLTLDELQDEAPMMVPEPSFLYSSRSYWYPQAMVSDYATARIRVTVPSAFECVASGNLEPGFPGLLAGGDPTQNRKVYVFTATRPLRYLAFLVSRFVSTGGTTVTFPPANDEEAAKDDYTSLNVAVETNPRQAQRGRDIEERAADIAAFYQSIVGDSPFQSFTVALIESDLPGGHSPGYFAELYQPLPYSPVVWRSDPASFSGYPEFFLAHEVAHQWWGQAVGWRNYHEQWISEAFAQYFAALYAQHHRGDEAFTEVLRQLRRWGLSDSDQGPIYLGYRLGHIKNEGRVFRALVYNKGAAVLHMLRRLVGDEPFFRGLRRFYRDNRFQKAGTEGLCDAMEAETGVPLERFFERWIYGSTLPKVKLTYRVEGADVVIRLEQIGEVFDVPVTVSLQYADRKSSDVLIPLMEAVLETRVPLAGTLRGAEISKDDGSLTEVVKN